MILHKLTEINGVRNTSRVRAGETLRFYISNVSRWMERITITKTLKCMFCGVPPSDLSRNVDIKHRGVLTWNSDSSPISPVHGKNRSVFRTYVAENEIVCWCYLMPFMFVSSVAYRYVMFISISRGLYQYISSYWHHTFSDLSLEIYRVGDNRWTINTSTVRTLLISWDRKCWLNIVMLIYRHDMKSGLQ